MLSRGNLAVGLSDTVLVLRGSGMMETAAVRLVKTIICPASPPVYPQVGLALA
jgi:hypothetical protein